MPRTVVMLLVALSAVLGALVEPAQAQFDSCNLEGTYVLSAFLSTGTDAQVSGSFTFTQPGTCGTAAAGNAQIDLLVQLAGSPTPTPVAGSFPYVVDTSGTLDIGPGLIRGAVGLDATGVANGFVFTADPSIAPPTIRLAGMAMRTEFSAGISSRRFKEDIHDIDDTSRGLLRLRPVTFRYKQRAGNGTRPRQFGLIAEEVARVYPELVEYTGTGEPLAIRYHLLPPLLLNELQAQARRLHAQKEEIQAQEAQIRAQDARVQAQAAQLAELAARLVRLEGGAAGAGSR